MNKTGFTKEQMEILRLNPFTRSVSTTTLKFTEEFKDQFWKLYLQGVQPEDIFRQSGYDPDLVGKKRIINTTHLITSRRAASTCNSEDVNYARLEGEVKALRKEIDTLKKIIELANSRKPRGC